MLTAGCVTRAPHWKKFAVPDDDSKAVIAGRFHASFKDDHRAKRCSVNISDVWVNFDEWGLVFMTVPPGPVRLKYLRCFDGHTPYEWILEPYEFEAKPGVVTYFGDVIIKWHTEGGYKVEQSFGLVGVLAMDPLEDPATIRLQSREAEVKQAFEELTGKRMQWRTDLAAEPEW